MKVSKLATLFHKSQLKDSCKLGLFFGLMSGLYKSILCLLRRLYPADQGDRANRRCAPIAGFLCGLALYIDNSSRKQYLVVLAMSRMIDTLLTSLQENGVIPKSKHYILLLWLLSNGYTQYCISC